MALTNFLNKEGLQTLWGKIEKSRLIPITWSELKALRDGDKLIPGKQYRITDYNCTTVQADTQSAGHQFDIIVTADSKNKLNEVARAIRQDGDENLPDATSTTTDGVTIKTAYFANSKLEAWKIWYCLDNDTKRFAWADATNGKGVIYRMIDEYNNDCPYDFKNIQFKRCKITKAKSSYLVGTYLGVLGVGEGIDMNDSKMFYTFSYLGKLSELTDYKGEVLQDASIVGNTLSNTEIGQFYGVYNNSIERSMDMTGDGIAIHCLNDIVFLTFLINGKYYGCHSNSFGDGCNHNSFGNDCSSNSFGDDCNHNSFGNSCSSNSFGNYCSSNSFGNDCYRNSFGNSCSYNSFGDGCSSNSFGDGCSSNSFGNYCSSNSFGNSYSSNSFGNSCYSNSFGDGCNYNSFGNSCSSNSFGNDCHRNSFGNYCSSNSFGDDCFRNLVGIDSSNNKLDVYYKYNKFDNVVKYVTFSGTGTSSKYIQNYHIKQGMIFTNSAPHTITAKPGLNYELTVAKQSDGTVVEYCEADLLKAIGDTTINNITA